MADYYTTEYYSTPMEAENIYTVPLPHRPIRKDNRTLTVKEMRLRKSPMGGIVSELMSEDEESEQSACCALDMLLLESPTARDDCVSLGAVTALSRIVLEGRGRDLREAASSALWSLCTGCAGAQLQVIEYAKGSVVEKLLHDMLHSKDASLRLNVTGVCATISTKLSGAEALRKAGGVSALIAAVDDKVLAVREQASLAIWGMAALDPISRTMLQTGGGAKRLISLLGENNHSTELKMRVCGAVRALALSSEDAKAVHSGIDGLMKVLNDDDYDKLHDPPKNTGRVPSKGNKDTGGSAAPASAPVVSNDSKTGASPEIDSVVLEKDNAADLLSLLKKEQDPVIVNHVCGLVAMLTQSKRGRDDVFTKGGLMVLKGLLESGKAVQFACAAIFGLTCVPKYQIEILKQCVIPILVKRLSNQEAPITRGWTAGALRNLAHNEFIQSAIFKAGAVPPLCAQLVSLDSTAACKRHCVVALWNLAYNEQNQIAMSKDDLVINSLANMLRSHDAETREGTMGALHNLSEVPANRARIVNAQAFPLIISSLQDIYPPVAELAAAVLFNMAETPEFQTLIGKAGGVEMLVGLLDCPTEDVRENAAAALVNIARDNPMTTQLVIDARALAKAKVFEEVSENFARLVLIAENKLSEREYESIDDELRLDGKASTTLML